ncbi:hypothetical protein GOP47_0022423 [Adiantum capillus-veneris]|uniref:Uncharacterized protein n=1 Tax=Adiantum capillus-veneris TaxID=13818 RepID=A0A9D4Z5B7_ADICA|nr:hypothetical protein GOP47_0022423 [Adiantum capillus-veneris]
MATKTVACGPFPQQACVASCMLHTFRRRRLTLSAAAGTPPITSASRPIHSTSPTINQAQLFTSTASEPLPPPASIKQRNLIDQHLFLLTTVVCVTGGTLTTLFLAAIPTLLAFKRAAESLEKLLEVTREELPGTMAAVRLSGMEISDLTMELSDLGQEISSGVKSSARVVRAAQDGLRKVSSIASMAFLQKQKALLPQAGSMKPVAGKKTAAGNYKHLALNRVKDFLAVILQEMFVILKKGSYLG